VVSTIVALGLSACSERSSPRPPRACRAAMRPASTPAACREPRPAVPWPRASAPRPTRRRVRAAGASSRPGPAWSRSAPAGRAGARRRTATSGSRPAPR